MKKILGIITALTLAMMLTACGEPADLYAKAVKRYNSAAGAECSFSDTTTFTKGADESVTTASGTVVISLGEARVMSLSGTMAIDPGVGTSIESPFEAYYSDGRYYASVNGNGVFYAAEWQEVLRQCGQYFFAEMLTEADFEAIIAEDTEDGGKLITYVVSADRAAVIPGLTSLWERYADMQVSVGAVQGKLNVDDSGRPVRQQLSISATVTDADGTNVIISKDCVTEIRLTDDTVSPASPIGGKYREIRN